MIKPNHRSLCITLAIAFAAMSPMAFGQTTPNPATPAGAASKDESYIALVKGSDVYVRCGAGESYYPFTKISAGEMVKVIGQSFEWSRVAPIGPAFANAFGYVKYAKNDTNRVRLAPDNKSLVTLGNVDIIAPNLDQKNSPKESWKSIIRMEVDQTLRVLEVNETDKDMILKVAVPERTQGWISTALLEHASKEQAKQFADMLANPTGLKTAEVPKATTPTNGPAANSTAKNNSTAVQPNKPVTVTPNAGKTETVAGTPAINEHDEPVVKTDGGATDGTDNAATKNPEHPDSAASPTTTNTPATTKPAEKKLPTLDDLEAALKVLQKEPIETAELTPLRELYLALAARSSDEPRTVRYSNGRAEQLQVWADLQKRRGEIDAMRNRNKSTADETEAVRKALESSAEYVAVGRVAASTLYDGKSLPKLLRLQDAASGRTVAYLQPDDQYELVNLIGNLVGIVGEKTFEDALRLNIVKPRRIDILTPDKNVTTTVNVTGTKSGADDGEAGK